MVRSKLADVVIPDVPLHRVVFSQVDKTGNQTVWVNYTLISGQKPYWN